MNEKTSKIFRIIYIVTFIILNLLFVFLLTCPGIVNNIITYEVTFYMMVSSFVGNLSCLTLMLGCGMVICKKKKSFYRYLFICSTVICTILFILSITCNYYGMMFSFENLANFNLVNSGDSAFFLFDTFPNTIKYSLPYFLIPGIVFGVTYFIYRKKLSIEDEKYKWDKRGQFNLGLGIIIGSLICIIGVNVTYNIKNNDTWYEYNATTLYNAQSTGLLNHVLDEFGNLIFGEQKLSAEEKENTLKEVELLKQDPDGINEYTGLLKDQNLLLVQLESFNNFLVGLEVNVDGLWQEVTPNINKLIQENIYFDSFYTSTGIGNTSDAEFTAMTGLYPTGSSYPIYKYDENTYQTLPQMFKEEDYYTFSTHANDGKFYTRNDVHVNMFGFDEHLGAEKLNVTEENTVHRWIGDADLFKQTIDKMKESNSKTFAFAVTITNHTPYAMPKNGVEDKWFACKDNFLPQGYELSTNNRYNEIFTGYLEYASYVDYAIREMMDYLEEVGMKENTTVILYGDHGVDTTIYDMFYNYPEKFNNTVNGIITYGHDNQLLYEYELLNNVPLIIIDEKLIGRQISLVRSNQTLQSTIVNLFGLEQKYYFSIDALSDKQDIAMTTKTELVFYDGVVISYASKKYVKLDEEEVDIEQLLKKYEYYKDLNDKIIKNDLLK